MKDIKIGDCVWIRGLVYSDCFGLRGKVLDVRQSAFFGPGVQRCRVDFNGKIRRLLNVHLVHAARRGESASTAA
ncbi:MAG TPA: hypothetical protein VGK48_21730 [Terriglobia bacterium]|jgi:hypothetical protein